MATTTKKKILIIDDDEELNELLSDFLSKNNFEVFTATHPTIGLEYFTQHQPHLIVLDIMLPEKTGFDLCKEIRETSKVPIIILSARGTLDDRLAGLDLGADDYMPKPYEPRELLARIQSVLRRTEIYRLGPESKILRSNDLLIDMNKASVTLAGNPLELTTMEFELLCLLMQNPGITLSREQVVDKLRGIEWDSIDRTIDVLISRLRSKLKDDVKNPKFLKTIWGSGYRFVGEVANY
jgi:two-component system phosphate regulon response regulator OmpR